MGRHGTGDQCHPGCGHDRPGCGQGSVWQVAPRQLRERPWRHQRGHRETADEPVVRVQQLAGEPGPERQIQADDRPGGECSEACEQEGAASRLRKRRVPRGSPAR